MPKTMTGRPFKNIIIVGAGPAGLLLALLLSNHGIPITILEAAAELDDRPRAAHYGAPAMPDLIRAGIMDVLQAKGLRINTLCWRQLGQDYGGYMAGFDAGPVVADVDGVDYRTLSYPLQHLDQLMLDLLVERYGSGVVKWQHTVADVGQDAGKAWVDVETPTSDKTSQSLRLEADYVVGCDGAKSAVRKALFGEDFPGFTWDAQIIATNTRYDFASKSDFKDVNFIVHPHHFYMAAKLTTDGLYRITYGETPGLSIEEYKARQPWKFETILPGRPKPDEYEIKDWAPYKMHQRCAPKFRVGRVLLAADAAHLCNPWGGLGITGGFVDCGGLYDCLAGIWGGKADESILDLYSEKRIEKYQTVINPVSQENFRRIRDKEPGTRYERDEFMQFLTKAETDEGLLKKILLGGLDVRYDFTQHYHKVDE
ncbi:hypothetical protein BD289DRAFT_437188 [Coniella lustricola]|uniref:FAD-binding domain-containing protein n=1 Tax=Coniella lustricola TaxID=2025994 RepID=A0A2T3A4A1_9PEZI|nr:hypothetical protein BD289DRAFT_437188 [Coniella lustricola]